jgi:uncharacterized protein (TIGR02466 family)
MAQPQLLFPTPLWRFQHPQPEALAAWAAHVLALQARDPDGLQLTNQGGWHSPTGLLRDPALAGLFGWLSGCCLEAMEHLGWDLALAQPAFNNAWAMVNRRGHGNRAHLHSNSLFSGVVYLQVPPGSGAIRFLDPRAGAQMLMPPLRPGVSSLADGRCSVVPTPGLMLLFPSWLWHEVEPSASDDPRIVVSFNLGMRALRPQDHPAGGDRPHPAGS